VRTKKSRAAGNKHALADVVGSGGCNHLTDGIN
jgi:hypothetical protein